LFSAAAESFAEIARRYPLLSAEDERRLFRQYHFGTERDRVQARELLMLSNVRLVISIAKGYRKRGLPLDDLLSAGMLGLDHAIRKFDPSRGFKFSTYATPWVNQRCQRTCQMELDVIHVPNDVKKINWTAFSNPDWTDEQIAAKHKVSVSRVRKAREAAYIGDSLDRAATSDTDVSDAHERLGDGSAEVQGDALGTAETALTVRSALDGLPELERQVVELRYGLGDTGEELTLKEIGDRLGLCRTKGEVEAVQRAAFSALREVLTLDDLAALSSS
jgi:RNA polymerase sigma factor (sigma-70 family)